MTLDISALLERAGVAGLQRIALSRITPNPDNPRRDFDPTEITALATSIHEQGLLQPISVFAADETGLHRIRFGERRYRAALEAGLSEIAAIISDPTDDVSALVDQVVENDQRVDLTTSELVEAIAALRRLGLSQADIARRLGRPPATISLYAAVPDMPPSLQALAATVTIRPLHDLYRLWRDAPASVDEFIGETPATAIDRRTVAAFGARLRQDAGRPAPQPSGSRVERRLPKQGVSADALTAHIRPEPAGTMGSVRIRYDGAAGTLMFPAILEEGRVMILLDGAKAEIIVAAEDVRILATSL